MKVIPATEPEDFEWIASRTGCVQTADFRAIKAIDAKGITRGMVGYCDWTNGSVRAHMAVDTPIAWRSLRFPTFHWVFEAADRVFLYGAIVERNLKSLAAAEALGLREFGRIPNGHEDGVDMVLMGIHRDVWRAAQREAA